jgi:hypothetical protein
MGRRSPIHQAWCDDCETGAHLFRNHSAVSHSSPSGEFGRPECQFSEPYDAAPRETTTIMNVPGFILGRPSAPDSDSAVGK